MALDTQIPLQVQNAPIANPLQSIGQIMQMRNLASEVQQRQALAEQEQQNTLKLKAANDQANRDLADQNKIQELSKNPDYAKAFGAGDYSALQGQVQPHIVNKLAEDAATLHAKLATTATANLKLWGEQRAATSETINGLKSLANTQGVPAMIAAVPGAFTELQKAGAVPANAPVPTITSVEDLDAFLAKNAAYQGAIDGALATQTKQQALDTAKQKAEHDAKMAPLQETELGQKTTGTTPITPDQQAQLDIQQTNADRAAAAAAETARHNVADERLSGGRLAVEQHREARAAAVEGPPTPQESSLIHQIAQGDVNPSLALSRMPAAVREKIIAGAGAENPNWAQAFATKKAFTDPASAQSKNLGTVSRIVEHIGRFENNSDKMGVAPAYAHGLNLSGDAAALNEDAHAISSELEKLVSGGVGTEGQVKAWQDALHSTLPSIRKGAINEISQLIGGQFQGMQQTYKAGTGNDLPVDRYVSPHGRAWLKKNGITVGGAEEQTTAPAASSSGWSVRVVK